MLSIIEVFFILFIHWFADFLYQDVRWATEKSRDLSALLKHTCVYSAIWLVSIWPWLGLNASLTFCMVTFVSHTATDYLTSKAVSKKFARGELGSPIPNTGAFTLIGADQLLHYAQLVVTYLALRPERAEQSFAMFAIF
jgi:hypothetical protein